MNQTYPMEENIKEYENDGDLHRYILRDDIIGTLISDTADLVDVAVTADWNTGIMNTWIESKHDDVFALSDKLPPMEIEGMSYNCSISEEAQRKIDEYEEVTGRKGNWGVIDWNGKEYIAFSDIDRYACKIWDYCEEAVYIDIEEKYNVKIVNDVSDLN